MSGEAIEYHSEEANASNSLAVLETTTQNGITCTWSGQVVDGVKSIKYKWDFNWDELKKKGVEELTGHIIAKRIYTTDTERIDVNLSESCSIVEKTIVNANQNPEPSVAFDYYLTPHYDPKIFYDEMFAATDQTDAILAIDGKKLNVNKSFLSFQSEFFRALFSSNFKEGQMTEIPIKDVTYEDFGLLMSFAYPNTVFPNGESEIYNRAHLLNVDYLDKTAEKLLELADRFLMPFVTDFVEYHLFHNSEISNEKLIWMADAYGMKNLLEKCVQSMDTVEKAKNLKASSEYEKLSDAAKARLFKRLVQLV